MPDDNRNPERPDTNPSEIEQLVEMELIQKRAAWKQAKARRGNLRALSLLFLVVVILAALVGFFIFLSPERVDELRARAPQPAQAPSPAASPP